MGMEYCLRTTALLSILAKRGCCHSMDQQLPICLLSEETK